VARALPIEIRHDQKLKIGFSGLLANNPKWSTITLIGNKFNLVDAVKLRGQAEQQLQNQATPADPVTARTMETRQLVHELQIYQVELELQNQTLLETSVELEQSLERYAVVVHSLSLTPC